MMKNKYSLYAYICCLLLMGFVALVLFPKWHNKAGESSLGWDAAGYYWYLPAAFIYKDIKQQKFGDSIIAKYDFTPEFEQSFIHESGNRVNTYSSGLALLQLPAFAAGHMLATPLGYDADGFSEPYQWAVQVWGLLAAFAGLWYFRKLLLHYFTDTVTAITLLLLVFGTNYLNYNAVDVTLTHSWLFLIFTLLMLNTRQFYIAPTYKYAVRIGLFTGLAILVRPSEMLIALIPLFWGMESISVRTIRERMNFLRVHLKQVSTTVVCVVAIGAVQILYWLYVTGKPLVYSYAEKGFSWIKPHFYEYTFSYRSGWLVYTPLMFFAIIGLVVYLKNGKNKVALIGYFLLTYYVVAAWDVWWYGGMGGRAMVQSYAIAFFFIAALVDALLRTKWVKLPAFAAILVFVYVNIWFTYNAHAKHGLYDPTSMTKTYYWAVVGRFKVPEYTKIYKDTDEYFTGTPNNMQPVYSYGFEDDTTASEVYPISGKRSYYFPPLMERSPELKIGREQIKGKSEWIRASATVKVMGVESESWKMHQFIVGFTWKGEKMKNNMIRINRFATPLQVGKISFDVKIPTQDFDSMYVLVWNPGSTVEVKIDDIKLSSFEE